MDIIFTENAPAPAGHYSQALLHNGLIFVSGQLPLDPLTLQVPEGGIEPQARQVIANIKAILEGAGSGLDKVLKSTIYIPDSSYWPDINRIYAECFGDHRPARAVIPCGDLHYGVLIEMEVIAAT